MRKHFYGWVGLFLISHLACSGTKNMPSNAPMQNELNDLISEHYENQFSEEYSPDSSYRSIYVERKPRVNSPFYTFDFVLVKNESSQIIVKDVITNCRSHRWLDNHTYRVVEIPGVVKQGKTKPKLHTYNCKQKF